MSTVAVRLQPIRRSLIESPIAGPLITFVVVFGLCALFVPKFLTMRSLAGIVNAATLTGVVTIGVTLLMIVGEFDLSVGTMMAFAAFLYGFNSTEGGNPIVALLLALLGPALMGTFNGLVVVRTRIPSFIATLSTLFIFRGLLWVFSTGQMFQTIEEPAIYGLLNGRLSVIADAIKGANFRTAALWWIALIIVFQYILIRTRFGNHVFATGGAKEAAAAQGVNINRTKVICFALSGILAGFAGVLLFSQFKTVRIATGAGEELKAIAAAVVGGTLLTGGSGSIVGSLLGVLIISTLRTGVVLADLIPADNFEAIVGITIVGAAIFNNWIRGRA